MNKYPGAVISKIKLVLLMQSEREFTDGKQFEALEMLLVPCLADFDFDGAYRLLTNLRILWILDRKYNLDIYVTDCCGSLLKFLLIEI